MNVTELARKLRVNTKEMLEILPQHGFDIGAKAIKIDNKVADQIMRKWRYIKRAIEDQKKRDLEEKKTKEKELRKESGETVSLPNLIRVRDFADRLNMSVTAVITELMKNGILANQNQDIDYDTAAIMAEELGFVVVRGEEEKINNEEEEKREKDLEEALASSTNLEKRAPVIVVMGHVDHGKTKLLDAVRQTNIIDTESGGITQHIGAYQTVWKDPKSGSERALSFIDTPGHEAFTVMRSRGAKVADIAILVVAADDGVKPQTEEVIKIIRAAKLPFIVAINKIDREGSDPQRVRTELSKHNVLCEDWGGDVPVVEISAKQKLNIDKLLDVLLLVADVNDDKIQADPNLPAVGTIIESHVDKSTGPVATVLVQSGTLHRSDPLVVNNEIYGKVRAMRDYLGKDIDTAGPSVPVQIFGFKVAPEVGDIMNLSKASEATKIDVKQKKSQQTGAERSTITVHAEDTEEDNAKKKTINLVIKADVLGSLEAIIGSLQKLKHDEVGVKIVGKGLGNITEDDVHKAQASGATMIGFHTNATSSAEELMRDENINFLQYEIIYDLINWVKAELEILLSDEVTIEEIGRAKVLAIFRTDKNAMTIGARVTQGRIDKNAKLKIKRKGEYAGEGIITQCKLGPQDVSEVTNGAECGLRYEGRDKIEEGDMLEFFVEHSKIKKLVFEE